MDSIIFQIISNSIKKNANDISLLTDLMDDRYASLAKSIVSMKRRQRLLNLGFIGSIGYLMYKSFDYDSHMNDLRKRLQMVEEELDEIEMKNN